MSSFTLSHCPVKPSLAAYAAATAALPPMLLMMLRSAHANNAQYEASQKGPK